MILSNGLSEMVVFFLEDDMTLIITNNQNTKDMVCKYINIKECVIDKKKF